MGWLVQDDTAVRSYLAERSLLGRATHCWIQLSHRSVSNEHAVFSFGAGGWSVKDLGSRNGTWANGKRLAPGESARLEMFSRLQFGDVGLVLESDGPPTLSAWAASGGEHVVAHAGMMSLPDDDNPLASIYEVDSGTWVIDIDGRTQPIADGDTFYVADRRYCLRVPGPNTCRTFESTVVAGGSMALQELTLSLVVSRDEESMLTELHGPTQSIEVPARATHQVLLVLARQRIEDQRLGLAESECGWIYSDDLARMMGADQQKINLDVHRVRQQLAKLGVLDAARIVERRIPTRQLRLGLARIQVQ